jgi:lipopolysaccharide transport system permease protein
MSPDLPVRVIVPHSGLQGFRHACSSLFSGFPQARALAWRLFLRDTRASYRQSLLGYFWIFLPPLASTLVWVLLNKSDVVRIDSGDVPYPLFVLAGTILWGAFNGSMMASLGVVNEARSILSKVNFPHEALFFNALLKSLLDAIIPATLIIAALLIYRVPFSPLMLLFPVSLLAMLALGLAAGLLIVPLASLYSDVGRAVQLALRFGFFVTPVIYPLPTDGMARTLMLCNPLSPLIVSGRTWLTGSGESLPLYFTAILTSSLILIALGLLIFKVVLPHLIERLSS